MSLPNAEDQVAAFTPPAAGGAPDWWKAAATPLTPAVAATGQSAQGQASAMRGVGGPGWNEDFDQDWANRMMKIYGVTMEDLRDPNTRRSLNRQQRESRATPPPSTGGTEPPPPGWNIPPGTGGIQPVPEPGGSTVRGPAGNPSQVYQQARKVVTSPGAPGDRPAPTGPMPDIYY